METARFNLSDGALILLTEGIFADSSGKIYGDKIEPDVLAKDDEQTIQRAAKWILNKPWKGFMQDVFLLNIFKVKIMYF